MSNAARVLDAACEPHAHRVASTGRRVKIRMQLYARHAEVESFEQLLARMAERIVEVFFGCFEPFEEAREPYDLRGVAIAPMDFSTRPEKRHARQYRLMPRT